MTAKDHAGTLFRRASAAPNDYSSSEDLRFTLQRRLYALSWVIAAWNALGGLLGLISPQMRAQTMSHPLSAGSSIFQALAACAVAAIALSVRPSAPRTVQCLRVYEAAMFTLCALLIALLHIFDYGTLRQAFTVAPIDIGFGMGSLWAFQMVAYGVLIPNTSRRVAIAMTLFILAPLLLDIWALAQGSLPVTVAPLVLAAKNILLLLVGFIIWFGSVRFEIVARREAAARELGQYVLGSPLGSGGMGEVFRGEHRMLRRPVAIKLISAEQAGSTEALARFEREAQATARLTHPNTVQIFDYGRAEDGTFYCVMELLDGETLDTIIERDGPMDVRRASHVMTQLCGALSEAHSMGLIHRDIKPSNVILGTRGGVDDVAKLLDFGLVTTHTPAGEAAKVMTNLTQAGAIVGTPEFMSPEQCGDPNGVGPASDLYSLGALGFYLVTGRSPFSGRSAMQILAAHLYEQPVAPSSYSAVITGEMDTLLLKALAKDPSARFASARDMSDALAS